MASNKTNAMLGRLVTVLVGVPAEMIGTLLDLVMKLKGKDGSDVFSDLKLFLRNVCNPLHFNGPNNSFVRLACVPFGKSFGRLAKELNIKVDADPEVLSAMPKVEKLVAEVIFFKNPKPTCHEGFHNIIECHDKLESMYEERNLIPVDPLTLLSCFYDLDTGGRGFNINTHWKDDSGNWCHFNYVNRGGECFVSIGLSEFTWYQDDVHAGVRKC